MSIHALSLESIFYIFEVEYLTRCIDNKVKPTTYSSDSISVKDPWKMRVITVYDDEREKIITYVSTYDIQGQSIKANCGQIKQPSHRDFILNT